MVTRGRFQAHDSEMTPLHVKSEADEAEVKTKRLVNSFKDRGGRPA